MLSIPTTENIKTSILPSILIIEVVFLEEESSTKANHGAHLETNPSATKIYGGGMATKVYIEG
jgi:hypothetical protein